ncbi:hypothetical protein LWP59_20540 [Amycolatopsis acidiphila]|uniref:hypothetical protein n=1 Tax=Amycolatopsis acidiphila TaxID=715473 RepID=UPI00164399BE|nr:hypothetical protein [Amycolatopsis acidiphila]UIJ56581.1 hypothetical protein LWP59_20540 [Amycolatopsis acidiphila]
MLFEGALPARLSPGRERALSLGLVLGCAAVVYLLLAWLAGGLEWTRASAQGCVGPVGLNAIGTSIILHVGIGRRRPFAPPGTGRA